MRYAKTYNPCDDCQHGFSKNNQESNVCKICEFKQLQDLINRQKAEIEKLESDCKTHSAVLSREVEADEGAIKTFIGFLEENAKIEVFKRPKINLDCEAKFLYIDDIKRLEKEFWEGDEQC